VGGWEGWDGAGEEEVGVDGEGDAVEFVWVIGGGLMG